MDGSPRLLEQMKLRTFDLSLRTARRSQTSATQRLGRWRARGFLIVQCAVAAGVAWLLGRFLLGHATPFFAPVAALVTLGTSYGQRLRRAVDVAIGVAVGVLTGDLFVHFVGTGVWQIVVVVALAMSIATLVGAGQIMIIQAGVQSIIVTTLLPQPGQGFSRWLDALVGCVLAVLITTVAPIGPLRKPWVLTASVLRGLADTTRDAAAALRSVDADAGDEVLARARAGEAALDTLSDAAAEGVAVVRHSPFRRRQLRNALALSDLQEPLDRANRNLRVLVRRCAVALWRAEPVPTGYLALVDGLAEVLDAMAAELTERRMPTDCRDALVSLAAASARVQLLDSMSAVVILAQVRSIVADLLELTGLDDDGARAAIPEMGFEGAVSSPTPDAPP